MVIDRFPEDLYPMGPQFIKECIEGYSLMKKYTFSLYGLARNCSTQMKYNRLRLLRLRQLTRLSPCHVITNGNEDDTLSQITSPLEATVLPDAKFHGSVISHERYSDMARYRNVGLEKCKAANTDFIVVMDFDTHGFSYDGFANSVYHLIHNSDIDFVGSNGLVYQDDVRLTYDALAFRRLGATKPHDITEINLSRYDRNDPMFRVQSCFGGLGIYRTSSLYNLKYQDDDCDHVTINRHLNCYLNPGMIVLYSKNPYEVY